MISFELNILKKLITQQIACGLDPDFLKVERAKYVEFSTELLDRFVALWFKFTNFTLLYKLRILKINFINCLKL